MLNIYDAALIQTGLILCKDWPGEAGEARLFELQKNRLCISQFPRPRNSTVKSTCHDNCCGGLSHWSKYNRTVSIRQPYIPNTRRTSLIVRVPHANSCTLINNYTTLSVVVFEKWCHYRMAEPPLTHFALDKNSRLPVKSQSPHFTLTPRLIEEVYFGKKRSL